VTDAPSEGRVWNCLGTTTGSEGSMHGVSGQQDLPAGGHDEVPGDGHVVTERAELDGVLPHTGQVATRRYRPGTGPASHPPDPCGSGTSACQSSWLLWSRDGVYRRFVTTER